MCQFDSANHLPNRMAFAIAAVEAGVATETEKEAEGGAVRRGCIRDMDKIPHARPRRRFVGGPENAHAVAFARATPAANLDQLCGIGRPLPGPPLGAGPRHIETT